MNIEEKDSQIHDFTQKAIYYSQLLEENENENFEEEKIITNEEHEKELPPFKNEINDNVWIEPTYLHPILTTFINFLLPGLGHIFMGQTKKGKALIIIYISLFSLTFILSLFLFGILFLPFLFFYFLNILYDGFILSKRIRSNYLVMEGECTTSLIKFGLSIFLNKNTLIFNHNKKNECPKLWCSMNQ